MKTYCLALISAVGISTVHAQIKYTSPESGEFKPMLVSTEDAKADAEAQSETCGYTKAFFSKADLDLLMNVPNCVGVRIYNSKETDKQTNCDVIAVAVDPNGKEIGPAVGNKYLHAKSYDENTSCTSRKITKTKAEASVRYVTSAKLSYQKVFFSKSLIEDRLRIGSGIAVLPGSSGDQSTMMITAASLVNGELKEMESNYFKSLLPCPTDCGDTANYLISPN